MRFTRVACRSRAFAASALLLGYVGGSFAQDATTAVYNDWTLRCTSAAPPSPQKICEIEQLTQADGKTISRIAVEQPQKGQPVKLVIQMPVNVTIANGVKIQIEEKDAGLSGPFTRCGPRGCFATITLADDAVRRFRSTTAPARIVFVNAAGRETAIPMSFKGFGSAFDMLK